MMLLGTITTEEYGGVGILWGIVSLGDPFKPGRCVERAYVVSRPRILPLNPLGLSAPLARSRFRFGPRFRLKVRKIHDASITPLR